MEDADLLRSLEESLWIPAMRFDRDHLEALLAPGFFEFGRSGRVWMRADVLATPAHDLHATIPLRDYITLLT